MYWRGSVLLSRILISKSGARFQCAAWTTVFADQIARFTLAPVRAKTLATNERRPARCKSHELLGRLPKNARQPA